MERVRLRFVLALVILGVVAAAIFQRQVAGSGQNDARESPELPNVLIVVVDTLRYDATALADPAIDTPYLRSLRERAFVFHQTYSTHDLTPPSHYSILSGIIDGRHTKLDAPQFGLPHQLAHFGYRSFGIVANGNLSKAAMPVLRSFDRYLNLYGQWNELAPHEREPHLGVIDGRIELYAGRHNDWTRAHVYTTAAKVLNELEERLEEHVGGGAPFFGLLNLMEPHDPYFPSPAYYPEPNHDIAGFDSDVRLRALPPELTSPEQAIADPEERARVLRKIEIAKGRAWSVSRDLTSEQLAEYRRRYDAEVREADAALQAIVDLLTQYGLLDSTVVVITSDHGEAFGEDGFITHALSDKGNREATMRVPLAFLLPPSYAASPRASWNEASIADIAPTLYEILGIDWSPLRERTPDANLGRSLVREMGLEPSKPIGSIKLVFRSEPDDDGAEEESQRLLRELGYIE